MVKQDKTFWNDSLGEILVDAKTRHFQKYISSLEIY